MAKVELKQPVVNEISGNLDGAKAALLVQYLGLTVEQDTALRKELRPNAIAISKEDPVAPARILAKYAKQYKVFNMVAGVVEGTYYDDKQLAELANVPSREVLLGRLFGSMQSPIANFARVIKQIAEPDAPAEEAPAAE